MTGMDVRDGVDRDLWLEVARACEYATFYHSPLWHALAASAVDGARDVTFHAVLADGKPAVFPLLKRRRAVLGVLGQTLSTFAGCYGGPIAPRPLEPAERLELYQAAAETGFHTILVGNPLLGPEAGPEGFDTEDDFTHLLTLNAPFEELFARFSKGHRSSTSKGRREGVSTRRAESIEDYRAYFRIYQEALDRWGADASSRYAWSLFERGHELAGHYPDNIVLWLGELDGSVVAGAWVFYWNRHATYWHGASSERGRETSAANVVLADVLADAERRGLEWFDFNPSGGHEGVAAFKRRFGTERAPFRRYRRTRQPVKALRALAALVRDPGGRP